MQAGGHDHAGDKRKAEACGTLAKDGVLDLEKSACGVLNAANANALASVLHGDGEAVIKSDCDAQLLISIAFPGPVKIRSVTIEGGEVAGPKTVSVPRSLAPSSPHIVCVPRTRTRAPPPLRRSSSSPTGTT